VQFTVALSEASSEPVKFKLATADGIGDHKATAGSDYVARAAEEFTIPRGTTSLTYNVTVNGDVFLGRERDVFRAADGRGRRDEREWR
jgi:hypothetical protein